MCGSRKYPPPPHPRKVVWFGMEIKGQRVVSLGNLILYYVGVQFYPWFEQFLFSFISYSYHIQY